MPVGAGLALLLSPYASARLAGSCVFDPDIAAELLLAIALIMGGEQGLFGSPDSVVMPLVVLESG